MSNNTLSLGNRMKTYENAIDFKLNPCMQYVIRLDGKGFSKMIKKWKCKKPFDERFNKAMNYASKKLFDIINTKNPKKQENQMKKLTAIILFLTLLLSVLTSAAVVFISLEVLFYEIYLVFQSLLNPPYISLLLLYHLGCRCISVHPGIGAILRLSVSDIV